VKGDPTILRPRVTPDPNQTRDLEARLAKVRPPADVIFISDRAPVRKVRKAPKLRLVKR
jgi:hypothetical protein